MPCLTMLPSKSLLQGVNNINDESANIRGDQNHNFEQDRAARVAQALSSGVLQAHHVPYLGNAGILESIIVAREQERRRAVLLAAASRAALGSQSFLSSNEAAAILGAEHQRALLLLGGRGMLGGSGGLLGGPHSHFSAFGSLGDLGALQRASSLGPLTSASGTTGAQPSSSGLLRDTASESRLPLASQTQVAEERRPTSPTSFLRNVRQQRGSRPANFAGDSIVLDAMERNGRKGRTGTFPQKLYKALADLEADGRTDIAAWLPSGNAFVISNPKAFDEDVMRKYFRMNHFSSFQRQCNLYEFGRITEGTDKGAYFHELFHRGRPVLASQIRRNKIKGETNSTGVKAESVVATQSKPSSTAAVDGIVSSFLKSNRRSSPGVGHGGESSLERAASVASDDEASESDISAE